MTKNPAAPAKAQSSIELLTVIAIAIVAYIVQNVVHEGLGHGGACLLAGGKPIALSTAYLDWESTHVSDIARRFVASAGTLANFLLGLLFWGWLRVAKNSSSIMRFFLWLSMTTNLLSATGYLLFSGALSVGDWVVVVKDWQPLWAWRLGLILSGILLYAFAVWAALSELTKLIGSGDDRHRRAFKLSVIPYLAGSFTSTLGSILNPMSPILIFTSAASSFGGTSALAWMTQLLKTSWFPQNTEPPIQISRNWSWILIAGILLALHITVLGPSVKF